MSDYLTVVTERISAARESAWPELNLARLDLSEIDLESLFATISRELPFLSGLDLSETRVEVLPESLGQLSNLTSLYLTGTRVEVLPESLGELSDLSRLVMNGCDLETVPSCVWNMASLRVLDLGNNCISLLPSSLGNLHKLDTLHLQNNLLHELPREAGSLQNLTILDLSGNPLPPELLAAAVEGTEELLEYLRAVHRDGQRISEAKLIFVGEGAVGKSSLLAALRDEPFDPDRETTHGIEIKQLTVTHDEVPIVLNCWDFGGQPIYRPTHQLFFTKPAVYLVAWKPREGPELGQVEYWISRIKDRAGTAACVHIVATHGGPGQRPAQLDRSKLLKRFGSTADGGMIAGFHHVDSKTGAGVSDLRRVIAITAGGLPHVTRWYPRSWLDVRHSLAELGEAYLRYERFQAVAAEHGLSATAARSLARNAHALGQIVYYDDDPALRDLVVLKADWLSVAIGFVLEDIPTEQAGGLLPHRRLPRIWADPGRDPHYQYSQELQQMFLRLMERFDLTYRAPDLTPDEPLSLVPQLLPGEPPPQLAQDWDGYRPGTGEVVQICQFVEQDSGRAADPPPGLMARLIVLFHRHSLGRRDVSQSVHWLHGLMLQDRYGARALLAMDTTGLSVRVKGVNPAAFLSHLVHEIREYVEGFWEGRRTKVLIPCPQPCGVAAVQRGHVDLDRVYRRLEAGKSTAQCDGPFCGDDIEIADLLTWFDERGPLPADQQAMVVREAVSGALAEQIGPQLRMHTEEILRSHRVAVNQISNGIWELGDQLDDHVRSMFSQLEERLAVLVRALDDEATDGPRLFGLEPLDRSVRHPGLTTYRMRLTLWCEHSRIPVHLLEPDRPDAGIYTVEIPRDWWAKAAPLIKTTSMLLKALLPIALPVIKTNLNDDPWESVEEQYLLSKESLDAAATLGEDLDDPSVDDLDRATGTRQPVLAEGGLLRMLHATLRQQDITYADLRKVRGEGHRVLWVHPRFEHIYNPDHPRIPT